MLIHGGGTGLGHVRRFFTVWVPALLIALYVGSVTALAAAAISWVVMGMAHGGRALFLAVFSAGALGALRAAWWMFRRALVAERALADLYSRMRLNRPVESGSPDPQL